MTRILLLSALLGAYLVGCHPLPAATVQTKGAIVAPRPALKVISIMPPSSVKRARAGLATMPVPMNNPRTGGENEVFSYSYFVTSYPIRFESQCSTNGGRTWDFCVVSHEGYLGWNIGQIILPKLPPALLAREVAFHSGWIEMLYIHTEKQ